MKTIVVAQHSPGPHQNGVGDCYARASNGGMCPGVERAKWLNGLGEDDEPYFTVHGKVVTNGDVRDNWLKSNHHIVPLQPVLANLQATERRLSAELRQVKRRIKEILSGGGQ